MKLLLVLKRQKTSELFNSSSSFFVPAIDEFGGYSSRLRIPEIVTERTEKVTPPENKKSAKKQALKLSASVTHKENGAKDSNGSLNLSLCHLLGIDVEKIALEIVTKDIKGKSLPWLIIGTHFNKGQNLWITQKEIKKDRP